MLHRNPNDLAEYTKDIEVNYPIEKIKDAIKETYSIKEAKIQQVLNEQDEFNSFTLARLSKLRANHIEINLSSIDENKTKMNFKTVNAGSKATTSILGNETNDYINVLLKTLKGEIKANKPEAKVGKSGCSIVLLLFVLGGLSAVYWI